MPTDRLSALDETFLRIESDAAHLHVGWTLVFEGEPPSTEELREHVAGRLPLLPRFRRRVICSPLRLHDPVWVDHADFDIANHVTRTSLPEPGGAAQLRALAGALLSIPLDRAHPLWRLHLIDGLRDGGFAIVGQAHHALVDGIAAVEVAMLLLDGEPASRCSEPVSWSPEPGPGLPERVLATAAERFRLGRSGASFAIRAMARPSAVGDGLAIARRIGSALAGIGRSAPPTRLNRQIGPQRTVAFAELSLPAAKELGRRCEATVNDVVLATASLALGRCLHRGGEAPPWLRVFVPVSTRAAGRAAELGNEISMVFVELPVGERNPRLALEEVSRQMRVHKRDGHAAGMRGLLQAAGMAPAAVRDGIAWMMTRPQTFNAVVSNVPGPRDPLYLLGRCVRAAYPAVPLVQGHGMSVGILSYRSVLHVGLYADPGVVPDLTEVAADFTRSFDAMRFALAPAVPDGDDNGPAAPPRPHGPARRRERVLV
jgi:WS/DGAT/MGAT family acyltransferase